MAEKETFTEQTLKRIRSGELSPATKKKRSLSRMIFLIDAIVVTLILVFLVSRNSEKDYTSATANTAGLTARFSVSNSSEAESYIMSLSLTSSLDAEKTWIFDKSIATVNLSHNKNVFYTSDISKNTLNLKILPGEVRTFTAMVPAYIINDYLNAHVPKKKRTIVDFVVPSETIDAELTVNLSEKKTLLISFEQEDI